jgi:t-SNARE complex subunit (syntaxin)
MNIVKLPENNEKYSENEINQIEKDVIDLNETFKIVNDLTYNQGVKINEIVDSVNLIQDNCQIAKNEIEIAEKLQIDNHKKQSLILGAGVIGISIPISSVIGIQVGLPLAIVGGLFMAPFYLMK